MVQLKYKILTLEKIAFGFVRHFFFVLATLKHGDFSESRAQRNEVKHTRTMQFSIIFRPRPDSRKIDKARRVALSLVLPIPFQFARNSDDNYSRAREEGERQDE